MVTKGKRAKRARFAFASSIAGSTFQCSLAKRGKRNKSERRLARPRSCKSPKVYRRLRPGRYVFSVRASATGVAYPTPATCRFRVVRAR